MVLNNSPIDEHIARVRYDNAALVHKPTGCKLPLVLRSLATFFAPPATVAGAEVKSG